MKLFSRVLAVLRRKNGFTLMEMIAGMAASTVFLLGVAAMLPAIQRNYVHTTERSYAKVVANSISSALRDQLTFATSVTLLDPIDSNGYQSVTIVRDNLEIVELKPDPLVIIQPVGGDALNGYTTIPGVSYDKSGTYFMNKEVNLSFRKIDDDVLEASIQVYYQNNIIYATTAAVETLNCEIEIGEEVPPPGP